MNPMGGLPRRKTMLSRLEAKPPKLVLDAGNALFRAPGLSDEAAKQRAKFVLDTMGALGTQVMAVGTRDLVAGLPWLLEASKGAKVKLLSANLREKTKDGERAPLDGSTVLTAGALKVGVIGASPADTGGPALPAVREQLKKLKGKVDLTVLLAAVPYPDVLQLSTELKGDIDLILQSSDSRGSNPQWNEGNEVISSGERGRSVGRLDLNLAGKGPWVNVDQVATEKQLLEGLDARVKELKERRKGVTDKAALQELDTTLIEMTKRRDEQAKKAGAGTAQGARTLKLTWVALDKNLADDEPLKAEVLKYEPTYAAPH
jgi:2',3'-cyclic-nucleotide 2'-phosphodiesterase (5'-nucleotidase family)